MGWQSTVLLFKTIDVGCQCTTQHVCRGVKILLATLCGLLAGGSGVRGKAKTSGLLQVKGPLFSLQGKGFGTAVHLWTACAGYPAGMLAAPGRQLNCNLTVGLVDLGNNCLARAGTADL